MALFSLDPIISFKLHLQRLFVVANSAFFNEPIKFCLQPFATTYYGENMASIMRHIQCFIMHLVIHAQYTCLYID